jgi:phage shock protein A
MGIFTRFSDIVNSNINAILDKAEDPEKIVRLMIQEMEDTLVEVRSAAARSIADKKDLNRRLGQLEEERDDWDSKAELALRKGREDLARAALVEKSRVTSAADIIRADYAAVDDGLAKLNDDISRLEKKLEDAKARQKALLARHKTANSRLAARKKIHDYKIDDAMIRFEQYTRRIDDVEGRIEAYDLGLPKDLNHEFAGLEAEETISRELDDLKKRVSSSGAASTEAD